MMNELNAWRSRAAIRWLEPDEMNTDYLGKKLREARFFLNHMSERERLAFDDKEPFDFYLSAFLNAAMSVRNSFQVRQDRSRNAAVKKWRAHWESGLSMEERLIYDFMRQDRVAEVHSTGSSRAVGVEERGLAAGTHSLASGTIYVSGPPDASPLAVFRAPMFSFTIAGRNRRVTEVCREYLTSLERMVAKFTSDHA